MAKSSKDASRKKASGGDDGGQRPASDPPLPPPLEAAPDAKSHPAIEAASNRPLNRWIVAATAGVGVVVMAVFFGVNGWDYPDGGAEALFYMVLAVWAVGAVWVIFAEDGGLPPTGIRIFTVLVLNILAIGVTARLVHQYRESGADLPILGGGTAAVAVITFFGMLWCDPQGLASKTSVRSAIAGMVTIVYMGLSGVILFNSQMVDRNAEAGVAATATSTGTSVVDADPPEAESAEPVPGTGDPEAGDGDQTSEDGATEGEEDEEPTWPVAQAATPAEVLKTLSWAFGAVIAFYFIGISAEHLSQERTVRAAALEGKDEELKAVRHNEVTERSTPPPDRAGSKTPDRSPPPEPTVAATTDRRLGGERRTGSSS